ncbi:hypothetical protein D3C81_1754240 [compost metagenome]
MLANKPATKPITIATGANAAAIGPVSRPQIRLVNKPVNMPIIGPARIALSKVPIESRKIGSFNIDTNCPPIMLMAIEITINTNV